MEILFSVVRETWHLLLEMAPYLLFGFLMAGILHVLIPQEKVAKHLAKNDMKAVIKASLFGVPLPLCSCGVIPVAAHLKKQGANKGPLLSFLVSTPTTGVDSILATYSLLGILFAIIRPIAALFSGLLAGFLSNRSIRNEADSQTNPGNTAAVSADSAIEKKSIVGKSSDAFRYAFFELIEDIGKWIIIGIVVGGLIGALVPANLIEKYLGNPWLAYPLMLVIGIPMYVCATGSIPIVAPLILNGMTPGAGLVFLFAGPATNTATLSFVGGEMGKKSLFAYLGSIAVGSILFGLLIDFIWHLSGHNLNLIGGTMEMLPEWLKVGSAGILLALIARALFSRKDEEVSGAGLVVTVPDMSCENCRRTIDQAIRKVDGVVEVHINLKQRKVEVVGSTQPENVFEAIEDAGYEVGDLENVK